MSDTRRKNVDWNVGGDPLTWDKIHVAVLMDIRDELQALNQKLFGVGPTVHEIERNTKLTARHTRPLSRDRICGACGRSDFASVRGRDQHVRRAHS